MADRARACCEYCRSQEIFSPDRFQIDHIQPQAKGGSDEATNLAWACGGCNNAKADATLGDDPETGSMVELFHPRRNTWSEHFRWSADVLAIEGLTPAGRATIQKLELNRPNLIRLREVLRDADTHPPDYVQFLTPR